MKKKILLIFVVFCIITISQVQALGIGVQGNFYLQFDDMAKDEEFSNEDEQKGSNKFGFSLLVSPSRQLHFAGNYYFSDTTHVIGITGDFIPEGIPFTFKIAGSGMTLLSNPSAWWLNFYWGIGGFVNLWILDSDEDSSINDFEFSGGLRIPIGLNLNIANGLFEIFAQISPSIGVRLGEESPFADWFFPVALGVRIWL